jgi:hypothetical protein
MRALLLALCLCACADAAPTPSCAELGCSTAPSGSPAIWTPCDTSVCWCRDPSDADAIACTPEGAR